MSYQFTNNEVEQFITEGFIRIDDGFPTQLANEVLDILWKDIPFDRNGPHTWTEPGVRLVMYSQKSFFDSVKIYGSASTIT